MFEYVSSSSKLGFFFILRDNLQYSNPDIIYSVWAKANMLVYAILFVIGLIYLSKWLFGTNEKSPTTPKVRKFVPVIFIILGTLILVVETYKNSWYLISCIVASMVSWRLLSKLEKYVNHIWMKKFQDKWLPSFPSFSQNVDCFFNTSSASWVSRNSRLRRAISFCSSDA